jgi:hypothetical protein
MSKKLYRIEDKTTGIVYKVTFERIVAHLDADGQAPLAPIEAILRGERVESTRAFLYNPEMMRLKNAQ